MNLSHKEFIGKRILITGGTQGIGKAIANRLGRYGARLLLNYAHNDDAAVETLSEFKKLGYTAELHKADMSRTEELDGMLDKILSPGPIDCLICNAAYQEKKGFFETDIDLLKKTLGVNILGNFQILQKVTKGMIKAKIPGRIVICSSGHGKMVFQGTFAYDVSKAALNHFMRCAALELIEHGIRLNAVDIGWTHTPGERRWFTREQQDSLSRTIPIGRSAQPDEIAAIIEFLLSDESGYVVGSLYGVDGGFSLRPNPAT